MGNAITEPKKKPLTIHDLTVKVGDYKTINEGDPEMKEDPEFPLKMMHEAMDKNNTIEGNAVKGTYVYYPNKNKPKMWIGNYKILNPEDILCKDIAAKIGMTEEQWKKYIENKKNENNKSNANGDFDYLNDEQKEALKKFLNMNNINYFHENTNENGFGESEFNYKRLDEQGYVGNNCRDPNNFRIHDTNEDGNSYKQNCGTLKNEMKKDFVEYNQNLFNVDDFKDENGEYDHNEYINKLNEEAERVRQHQEQEIYRQQRELMYYGNSGMGCDSQIERQASPILPRIEMAPVEFMNEDEFEYVEEDEFTELDENVSVTNFEDHRTTQEQEQSQEQKQTRQKEKKIERGRKQKENQKKEIKSKHERKSKVETKRNTKEEKKETELQTNLKGKSKKEPIKAKINSFLKKNTSINKPEVVSKKNSNISYKTMTSLNTKSTIGVINSKSSISDKTKNAKNAKLKKGVAQ